MNKVIISDTPHIRSPRTTKGIMIDVCIALLPAVIMGCVFFGWKALMILGLSCVSCLVTEFVYALCLKKSVKTIIKEFDFTSLVTGLLLGMVFSSNVDWYVPILSGIFAIAVVKMLFGGTGKNIVNPAITGRIFAFIAFPATMISGWAQTTIPAINETVNTGATALTGLLANGSAGISNLDLFLGTGVQGCIGETCKIALIIGGVYLVCRKVIDWKWPLLYIITEGLMACILGKSMSMFLPSILSGGLILGAIFMATDYVTSPSNSLACYFYFIILGIITAILRNATGIEVVSFAILLMNLLVPLFNKHIKPRPFGSPKLFSKKAKKEDVK